MKALKTIRLYLGRNESTGGALEVNFYEGQEIDRKYLTEYKHQLEANGVIRDVGGENKRPHKSKTRGE